MIIPIIHDARIESHETIVNGKTRVQYYVAHPCNGAILAYCDTRVEAELYREAINDLPRILRAPAVSEVWGFKVEVQS